MFRLSTLLLVVVSLALAGCASAKLRQSAEAFGTNTGKAVAFQQDQLSIYQADKLEEAYRFYVNNRVALANNVACDTALVGSVPAAVVSACALEPRTPQPDLVPALQANNIQRLAKSLGGYANSLAVLAGDFSGDSDALITALTGVAGNVKLLDGHLATATGREVGLLQAGQVDAITNLVGSVANAYFQVQRDRALVRLIKETDPVVQETVAILSEAMLLLRDARAVVAYRALQDAVEAHENALAAGVSGKKLRVVNDAMFVELAEYKAAAAISNPFPDIGAAHTALKNVTRSRADVQKLIEHLANIIEDAGALAQAS